MAAIADCEMCGALSQQTTEKKLFYCTFPNCRRANTRLCLECGLLSHRRHNIYNHEFCGEQRNKLHIQSTYETAIIAKETQISSIQYGAMQFGCKGSQAVSVIYQAGKAALKEGAKKYTAKQIMQAGMKEVGKHGTKAAKLGLTKSVAGLQVIVCIWEIGVEYNRYNKGIISKKELERLIVRSVTANGASLGGAAGGAALGVWVGGPLGAVVGGIVGGIAADLASRFLFDRWVWSNETQKEYESDIKKALLTFRYLGVELKDVWKDDTFNRNVVVRTYHDLALDCHPDRPYGSDRKFATLLKCYNILLGILTEKERRN